VVKKRGGPGIRGTENSDTRVAYVLGGGCLKRKKGKKRGVNEKVGNWREQKQKGLGIIE